MSELAGLAHFSTESGAASACQTCAFTLFPTVLYTSNLYRFTIKHQLIKDAAFHIMIVIFKLFIHSAIEISCAYHHGSREPS